MTARVLVTRAAGTWPALTARFRGTPVVLEMTPTAIQVEPVDRRPGDEAIGRLHAYDWLVVTSGQGVKALVLRLAARGIPNVPPGMRVAAVGPATARALQGIGLRVELCADDARAEGLVALVSPRLVDGARVLLVRPEGVQSLLAAMLRARGARVDEAPLYRTIVSEAAKDLVDAAIADAFAAVVLTAPSSLDLWLEAAGARRGVLVGALARSRRVAIGPTTAAHLAAIGLPADAVADEPSEDAVGDAIARVLRL
jgi:uroporphyrinogen III methyltransferase/synthase